MSKENEAGFSQWCPMVEWEEMKANMKYKELMRLNALKHECEGISIEGDQALEQFD